MHPKFRAPKLCVYFYCAPSGGLSFCWAPAQTQRIYTTVHKDSGEHPVCHLLNVTYFKLFITVLNAKINNSLTTLTISLFIFVYFQATVELFLLVNLHYHAVSCSCCLTPPFHYSFISKQM